MRGLRFSGNSSIAQRLMHNPVLAFAYEHAWRPFNGWTLAQYLAATAPVRGMAVPLGTLGRDEYD